MNIKTIEPSAYNIIDPPYSTIRSRYVNQTYFSSRLHCTTIKALNRGTWDKPSETTAYCRLGTH